uniref:CoA transferase n=1 Tax=candidate division WOR-3 bacterium TaxID=2052148 RepID=A0A7C2K4A8_UNCW3
MKALEGLKVVGLVTAGAGPMLLRTLAIHGAQVVVIETTKRPNVTRLSGPYKDGKPGPDRSYSFAISLNGGYSLLLDLKHPKAEVVKKRLIEWADVIVENWRPGVVERLGMGYEEVKKIKPDIIMLSISHMGRGGPYSHMPGWGITLSALSGLMFLTGWPDRSPVNLGGLGILPDYISPRFGVIAIMAAIEYKRQTGKGQYIDLSQYECCLQFQIPALLEYTCNKRIPMRMGNKSEIACPHNVYKCRGEDNWCAISINSDEEWEKFAKIMEKPWLAKKFKTFKERKKHEDEIDAIIEEWTRNFDPFELMHILQKHGIAAGVVRDIKSALSCPQLTHRSYWKKLTHPVLGTAIYQGPSYILSETPYELQRPPCLGEHTEFVCTQLLGFSDEEFVKLLQEGVFQ